MPNNLHATELLDDIYNAAVDPGAWSGALERLRRTFAACSVHLSTEDYAMTRGRLVSVGSDPTFARRYAEYYVTRNVLWQRLQQRRFGSLTTSRMLMPSGELRRTEFYNDFLRPQQGDEILVLTPIWDEDGATTLTIWRSSRFGAWEKPDLERLAPLLPHLRRALEANKRLDAVRLTADFALEVLDNLKHGAIVVDERGYLRYANRAAEGLFGVDGALRLDRGRIAAQKGSDTTMLHHLIAAAVQRRVGGSLTLARQGAPAVLALVIPPRGERIGPRPAHAILFIKDVERSTSVALTAFTRHFGLTPAQAALAQQMAAGGGVPAAAARLGISYATARTHLLQIFHKTDTRRQSDLVRLLLEWNDFPTEISGC